jgi:chromosome segregation ATPase
MRFLPAVLFAALAFPQLAYCHGHSSHRTHIVETDSGLDIEIVRGDSEHWASYKRNGVRYVTKDAAVLAQIEKAMEKHGAMSREYSELGRRHSELGREHSELGREHSRLGREHSRLGRVSSVEAERRQRELEAEQRKLEDKQRTLENRQRELESKQNELESRKRAAESDAYREIGKIFERAVRDGKAKRD